MIVCAASTVVLVVTVPVGLFTSVAVDRAVSLGFYAVGSFLVVVGLLSGSRGPLRSDGDTHVPSLGGPRRLRRATRDELYEAINGAAVVILVGFLLLAFGVVFDSRYRLF